MLVVSFPDNFPAWPNSNKQSPLLLTTALAPWLWAPCDRLWQRHDWQTADTKRAIHQNRGRLLRRGPVRATGSLAFWHSFRIGKNRLAAIKHGSNSTFYVAVVHCDPTFPSVHFKCSWRPVSGEIIEALGRVNWKMWLPMEDNSYTHLSPRTTYPVRGYHEYETYTVSQERQDMNRREHWHKA